MHSLFSNIQFGPFHTSYHRKVVDEHFRDAFFQYLELELLPQVDEPFHSSEGSLIAEVNDDKFCGPNSLVKDKYKLKLSLIRKGSFLQKGARDELEATIRRRKTGAFEGSLYLWTTKRKAREAAFRKGIEDMVAAILSGKSGDWRCPRCASELTPTNTHDFFDLRCPQFCFDYSFHRDPATKEFRSGHFFRNPSRRFE